MNKFNAIWHLHFLNLIVKQQFTSLIITVVSFNMLSYIKLDLEELKLFKMARNL